MKQIAMYEKVKETKSLSLSCYNMTNLTSVVQAYPHLFNIITTLDLNSNYIKDISAVLNFPKLETLLLRDNEISYLPDLSGMTNLKKISLANNPLMGIAELAKLPAMEDLDLFNTYWRYRYLNPERNYETRKETRKAFYSPLAKMKKLKKLDIMHNDIDSSYRMRGMLPVNCVLRNEY